MGWKKSGESDKLGNVGWFFLAWTKLMDDKVSMDEIDRLTLNILDDMHKKRVTTRIENCEKKSCLFKNGACDPKQTPCDEGACIPGGALGP